MTFSMPQTKPVQALTHTFPESNEKPSQGFYFIGAYLCCVEFKPFPSV